MNADIEPLGSVNRLSAKAELTKYIESCPLYRSDDYLDFFHLVLSMNPEIASKGNSCGYPVKDLVSFSRDQILQNQKMVKKKDREPSLQTASGNSNIAQEPGLHSSLNTALETSGMSFFQPELIWSPGYFDAVQHLNEKYGIISDTVDYAGNKQIVYDRLINQEHLMPQIQPFQNILDDFVYEKQKPPKKIPLPLEMREDTSAKLFTESNVFHMIKKLSNAKKTSLGPNFFSKQDDPYIPAVSGSYFMKNDANETDSGVQKVDDFTQVQLADHLDKIRLTHMSNNRNFNSYANYLSLKSSDLVEAFQRLTGEFIKHLSSISKQHKPAARPTALRRLATTVGKLRQSPSAILVQDKSADMSPQNTQQIWSGSPRGAVKPKLETTRTDSRTAFLDNSTSMGKPKPRISVTGLESRRIKAGSPVMVSTPRESKVSSATPKAFRLLSAFQGNGSPPRSPDTTRR